MVLLNRIIPEVSCVVNDSARGIRRVVEHLGGLGHERIHYVAGPENSWADGIRWRALREAGAELELDVRRLGPNEPTVLAGLSAARRVAHCDATAVLAYNDALAIGVMKGLRKIGIPVPEEVSVVGFDNIIFDELVEPTLTTIAAPLYRMGLTGVRNCIALAQGARTNGAALVLPVRLVVRESTGRRRVTR
jgi:LacI family transcriptional regulator